MTRVSNIIIVQGDSDQAGTQIWRCAECGGHEGGMVEPATTTTISQRRSLRSPHSSSITQPLQVDHLTTKAPKGYPLPCLSLFWQISGGDEFSAIQEMACPGAVLS